MPDLRTYDIGTVAVTAAGAVTVTTGIWNDANVQPGDSISIDGGPALLIRSKSDTSHAQIVGWDGGDVSGKSYVVFQNASYRFDDVELGLDLKDQVTALNKINYFIPVQDDEAAPDPSLGDENQRAFKDLTGEWWKKEGGVWVRKSSPYGMQTAPIFSFEGDSLTNTSVHGTWPLLIREQSGFFGRGNHHQFAASGETAATMVGEYASQAGALAIAAEQEAYFFLWAGTNDITAGDSASTIYGNLKTLWVAARTTGYKVVAFTIMPRGDINSTQNDVRIALNALILSDPSLYDFVVRPDVIFSNPADTVNYISDTLHLTDAGNAIIARHVIAAVLGVQTVPAAPFDAMAHSNLVINGACEVAQEAGTGVKTGFVGAASPAYAVDGISISASGSFALSSQQVADAPPGLTNSIKITVTTASPSLGSSDYATIRIPIEGFRTSRLSFGTANARPVTVGFWTKFHRTGLYSAMLRNGSGGRSYPFAFTHNVSDAWEFKTVVVPGDVAGTWIGNTNGVGLLMFIILACGSAFMGYASVWNAATALGVSGTTNGVASTSDAFQATGMLILPGAFDAFNSNQAAMLLRPFDEELALSQRYWRSTYNHGVSPGTLTRIGSLSCTLPAATSNSTIAQWQFSEMRDIPAVTVYSTDTGVLGNAYNINAAADVTATVGGNIGTKSAHILWSGASASAGQSILVHAVANARL